MLGACPPYPISNSMMKVDLSEVRRILSDESKSITSFNNLLELKFLSSAVKERWMLARDIDEVRNFLVIVLALIPNRFSLSPII